MSASSARCPRSLADWVRDQARPIVEDGLAHAGFAASVRVDGDRLYIGYEPLFEETGLVRPEVMIEFGARSSGEPHEIRHVVCDAASHLPDLAFPETSTPSCWRNEPSGRVTGGYMGLVAACRVNGHFSGAGPWFVHRTAEPSWPLAQCSSASCWRCPAA